METIKDLCQTPTAIRADRGAALIAATQGRGSGCGGRWSLGSGGGRSSLNFWSFTQCKITLRWVSILLSVSSIALSVELATSVLYVLPLLDRADEVVE
jgi:hypothetical protein